MVSEKELSKIKKEIEKVFPEDLALQQIHIARKVISREAEMKGIKYIDYIKSITKNLNITQ